MSHISGRATICIAGSEKQSAITGGWLPPRRRPAIGLTILPSSHSPSVIGLNDPTINVDNVVFHSLRHTSTGVKLRLSKGDLKAVQGDGGWNSPDMVTKRYAHILDEDRRRLADEMEQSFYKGKAEEAPVAAAPALDAEALASLLASNPELLKKALESVQLANNT